AMFASLRGRMPFETWEEEFVHLYVDHGVADRPDGQVELLCPGEIEAQVYANAPLTDGFGFLEHLAVPALVIRGAQSPGFGARPASGPPSARSSPSASSCSRAGSSSPSRCTARARSGHELASVSPTSRCPPPTVRPSASPPPAAAASSSSATGVTGDRSA